MAFQGLVGVVHVRLVMPAMVYLHCHLIYGGLKRGRGIGEGGRGGSHDGLLVEREWGRRFAVTAYRGRGGKVIISPKQGPASGAKARGVRAIPAPDRAGSASEVKRGTAGYESLRLRSRPPRC